MTDPGWFVDQSGEHALRYWDGSAWTTHTAVPSPALPPARPRPPTAPRPMRSWRAAGWVGLVLCVVAAIAIGVQVAAFVDATDKPTAQVDETPRRISLAPDTTYGIFVDDLDDDGYYSSGCSVEDSAGRPVELRPGSWFAIAGDTEWLDRRFDSGDGDVEISCESSGDPVEVRPYVALGPLLSIGLGSTAAGTIGLTLVVLWFVRWLQLRSARRTSSDQVA